MAFAYYFYFSFYLYLISISLAFKTSEILRLTKIFLTFSAKFDLSEFNSNFYSFISPISISFFIRVINFLSTLYSFLIMELLYSLKNTSLQGVNFFLKKKRALRSGGEEIVGSKKEGASNLNAAVLPLLGASASLPRIRFDQLMYFC